MKTRYQRLTKEEREQARSEYIKRNPETYKKFKKLSNLSIVGIIYAIIVLCFDIIYRGTLLSGSFTTNIILDGFVLVFCTTFYFFSKDTIERQTNKMLVEDLRKKQIDKWNKEQAKLKEEVKIDYEKKSSNKKTTKKKVEKKSTKKSTTKKTTKKNKE